MGLLDTIVDIFNGKADNWRDRLTGNITLVSPEGQSYTPKYIGSDSFSHVKRLGIFNYPLTKGTVVQDLDIESATISIPFYFDGKDNDSLGKSFFASCKQRGLWEVIHNIYGKCSLQLVSVSMLNSLDGITAFETEWIEPIDDIQLQTAKELAGIVDNKITEVNLSSVEQFVADIKQTSETLNYYTTKTSEGIENVVDYVLSPLFGTVDALDKAMTSIHSGIQDSLNAITIPLESLAGQLQDLIEFPALASRDLINRTNLYSDNLVTEFSALSPTGLKTPLQKTASVESKQNNLAVLDLGFSSILTSLARIAITSDYDSREEIINTIDTVLSTFSTIVETLESFNETFETEYIDRQYFSQSNKYTSLLSLIYATVRYLVKKSFDLKIKQTIILEKPNTPIALTYLYYKDYELLDYFCNTNNLKGKEIIYLPAGKEISIYV